MGKNIIKNQYQTYFEQLRIIDTAYIDNVLNSEDDINFSLENFAKDFSFKQLKDDELLINPNILEIDSNNTKNQYLKIDKNFDNINDPIYEIDDAIDKVLHKSLTAKENKQKSIIKNKLKKIKT